METQKLVMIFVCIALTVSLGFPAAANESVQTGSPGGEVLFSLKANGGLGTGIGIAGVSFSLIPHESFELEGAVGYGIHGIGLALMPKFRYGDGTHFFVTGLGLSVSIPPGLVEQQKPLDTSLWMNVDVASYEYQHSNGFTLLIAAGLSVGLAGGTYKPFCLENCEPNKYETMAGKVLPLARIAIGCTF